MSNLSRRGLLGAGPLLLAGCGRANGEYFGNTALPRSRALAHTLPVEPGTLDPALSTGSSEFWVIPALDDFTFRVELRSPTPFFLNLITQYIFHPVPRHAIEAARRYGNESAWTRPGRMVSSGPFLLNEWRPYDRITAVRNPMYYDSAMVDIDELQFAPVVSGSTM